MFSLEWATNSGMLLSSKPTVTPRATPANALFDAGGSCYRPREVLLHAALDLGQLRDAA